MEKPMAATRAVYLVFHLVVKKVAPKAERRAESSAFSKAGKLAEP